MARNKKHLQNIRKAIKSKNWKQGSCLYVGKNNFLITNCQALKKEGLYIVLSQDCDLLHESFETEPFCELIYAEKITKLNDNYIAGKNPRIIHIPILTNGEHHYYECSIKNRFFIDRKHLLKRGISSSSEHIIETKTRYNIIDWLTKRYRRVAFPDAFVNRINKKAIKKQLEKNMSYINSLYIRLSTFDELDDNTKYDINLYMLIEDDINDEKKGALKQTLDRIVNIIEKKQIKVSNSKVWKINEIPYGMILTSQYFDFDYLSYL